jgi:LysR family hydrogen peroxide-inducible transcriptional activator
MTLSELRYIVAVANERSFGRAARRCFVSQPALSVAIHKLEEELGARLFERGKSEIAVTPVGARVVEQAQKVLEEAVRITEIAQAGRNQLAGVLRLGVIFTVAPYLLPDLIPALHECAPQMPLDLDENLTEHLESALRSGRIDVAIIALPFAPPGIVTEFLYEEPFCVVVPADHKWAKRKSIHPDELAAEQLILLDIGHCFRAQVLDACPELNPAEARVTRTSSLETGAQHGGVRSRRLGAPARCIDAEVPQPAGGPHPFRSAGAVAARGARLPQELSAPGGDQGDPRGGGRVPNRRAFTP